MLTDSVFRTLWRRSGLAFLALLAPVLLGQTAAVSDGFDPNIDGVVFAVTVQPNGQILVGGLFSTVTPAGATAAALRNNILRLNTDGSVDSTFNPNANGQVSALLLQPDGKILIAGKFTSIGGATRNRIARLNANGTVDTGFNPNAGGSLTPQVNALALQADGKVVLGGGFGTLQPNGAASATARNRLARVNADGSLDTTFDPNANSMVAALAIQRDGRILVGGGFTALQPNGAAAATTRNRLARLNSDGSLDATFDPNADNLVATIALHRDGRILIGGNFTTLQPNGATETTFRLHLASLLANGTVDASFQPSANNNVAALALQPDGRVLVGGYFSDLRTNSATSASGRNYIGRFNSDGTLDPDFNPNANYVVNAIAVQTDGRILLGGNFTTIHPGGSGVPATRNHLARINADGTLDENFEPDANGRPVVAALQSDGALIVGGTFTSIGGVTRQGVGRIRADGTVDTGFDPKINGAVRAILVQADNKIILGGTFTTVGTTARANLARLNADGTLDTAFNPNPNGTVLCLIQQSDNKIILGGNFTVLSRNNNVDPITTDTDNDLRARSNIARLNLDGTLDDVFDPTADGIVMAVKLQTDGKILVGGSFQTFRPNGSFFSTYHSGVARLNADGTLDNAFDPGPNDIVNSLLLQSDGKIIIGGRFTTVSLHNNIDSNPRDTDSERPARNRIARVNADGTLDTAFDPNVSAQVLALANHTGGKILLAGNFTTVQANNASSATTRRNIARLNTDGSLDNTFDPAPNDSPDSQITALAVQGDGKVLLLGGFTSLQPNGAASPTARNHLARLTETGALDTAYNPGVTGALPAQINALALQSDGKIIAGGKFTGYGGSVGNNLVRFLPDSSPDTRFAPLVGNQAADQVYAILAPPTGESLATQSNGFAWLTSGGRLNTSFSSTAASRISGQVAAIAVQGNRILVGGGFSSTEWVGGTNLVRYNADGTVDTTFVPMPNNLVQAIAVQTDGKIIVGGAFTTIAGVARNYLVRLNTDGTLDAAFNPGLDGQVNSLVLQPDGSLVVAGSFFSLTPNGSNVTVFRAYIARLKFDTAGTITVDTTFDPSPNFPVTSVARQSDGAFVIGGIFDTVKPNGAATTTTRHHLARIKADGTLDTTFDPNANGTVYAVALQADGQIVVGGSFTSLQPNSAASATTRNAIARLKADGTLDTAFDPNVSGSVGTIAVQSDGKILLGGPFVALSPNGSLAAISRNHLARLEVNGTVDTSFNPNANGDIGVVLQHPDGSILVGGTLSTLQPSGAILVGGTFANVSGATVANLTLLNSDGSLNSTFLPNPDGPVHALMLDPTGRVLVGGAFANISGQTRSRLARYSADNVLDATFSPAINGPVYAIAQPGDGRLLIGGAFTSAAGAARTYLARLNADGTIDSSFNPSLTGAVSSILVQSDGKILLTVNTATSGPAVNRLARLNADGSADTAFTSTADGSVTALAVRTDGVIYAGGTFTTFNGTAVTRLARLSAGGTVDATFRPAVNGPIASLTLQTDGKLLAGGSFTSVDSYARQGIARFAAGTPAADSITVSTDRTTLTLVRGGSSPQLAGVAFESSTDNRVWTSLGAATRTGSTGNWQRTGLSLPLQTYFHIRAREILPSTQNSSSGLAQIQREFYLDNVPAFSGPTVASAATGFGFYYAAAATGSPASYGALGLPTGLTLNPATGVITGTPTASGVFVVLLRAVNSTGIGTATLTLLVSSVPDVRFINLSTNSVVDSTRPIIAGFVVTGTEPRSMLLRAVGPGLGGFVSSALLTNPRLDLYNASGQRLTTTTAWGGGSSLSTTFARLGAFPLVPTSADAAIVVTLNPGIYTFIVSDTAGGAGGTALAEIYDASIDPSYGASRLVNLSSRGTVTATSSVVTGGFVVMGNTAKRVLVRGIGPALATAGVSGALADPILGVFDGSGTLLARNDDWQAQVTLSGSYPAGTVTEVTAAAAAAGAFALTNASRDSAVLITLAPGIYTAQISGSAGATGAAMIEIYELP